MRKWNSKRCVRSSEPSVVTEVTTFHGFVVTSRLREVELLD